MFNNDFRKGKSFNPGDLIKILDKEPIFYPKAQASNFIGMIIGAYHRFNEDYGTLYTVLFGNNTIQLWYDEMERI